MRSSKPASGKLPFFRTLSRAFLLQIPKLYLFCQHYLAQHLLHCSCPKRPLVHYTTKKGENKNSQIGISIIEPGKMVIEANRRKLHFPVYAFIFNFSVFSRFPGENVKLTIKQRNKMDFTAKLATLTSLSLNKRSSKLVQDGKSIFQKGFIYSVLLSFCDSSL